MTKQELIDKIVGFEENEFQCVMVICGSIKDDMVEHSAIIEGDRETLCTVCAVECLSGNEGCEGFKTVFKDTSEVIRGKEKEEKEKRKAEHDMKVKNLLG